MSKKKNYAVELDSVSVCWKNNVIFDSLSFALPKGEWSCLLGKSGIGKTTLLHLIAGLNIGVSFSGKITFIDTLEAPASIALMTQQDGLLPWATALDNIYIGDILRHGQRHAKKNHAHEHARTLLGKIGLSGRENALPASFSGGERQRIALARTAFEDRPIVLMDEPFSALDSVTRYKIQNLAFSLFKEKTVLHVTHDPMEAARLGHHIFTLEEKKMKTRTPPQEEAPRPIGHEDITRWHACWVEEHFHQS